MRKQRIISVLLTLCMVLSLLPVSALAASVEDFTDVSKDSWYYKEVDWVADNGYFKGTSETTFAPEDAMTRAMFVTVLARYAGAKVNDTVSTFTDVPANQWYTGAVTWAAKNEIVEGRGNGIFDPHASVTREEMCTILDRYLVASGRLAKLTKTPATINDMDTVSDWAKTAVEDCVKYGVIYGYPDGTFQPRTTATRAHVAALLYRLQLRITGGGGSTTGGDNTYTLTLMAGTGGTVAFTDAAYAGKTSVDVAANTKVGVSAAADDGYTFSKWVIVAADLTETDAAVTDGKYTVTADTTLKALFVHDEPDQVTVTVTSNNTSMGTVTGGGTKAKGSAFTLIATPADGYHFVNWTEAGKDAVTANPYTLQNVTENRSLVGNFEVNDPGMVTVSVVSLNAEWGTALVNGASSAYVAKDTKVTAVATPVSEAYYFVGWKTAKDATIYVSTEASYEFAAYGVTLYAEFAEVQDLTYQAASNLTTYLNGNVGGDGADIYFPTEEIAYISAIALSDAYDAEGTKTADVSITGRATLTTELVREVYTEAIAEAHVLYDILRAELDGATDTKAQLVAELKAIAKDVFAAVGYEPDAETLNAIAEEIYAKVVSLYREIANKTLGKDDLNKSGLTTTIGAYNEVKALTKQELNAVREAVRTAVKTYNGDYAFDTAVISVDGTDLFSIDVSKGFVLNYADNFKNSSIDLPDGKKVFVKETAVALAHQMRASNPKTDWTNTVQFDGHVTMTLGIKDAVANSPAYDCTEVFELGCSLKVTDQTNTVMYKYDGVKDYIKITIPDKVEKEYNEKVPAIWTKVLDYVMDNPDVLDRFSGKAGEPAVATFAMKRSTSGLNFNIDEIMANADKYLTPDATLGLVNGNDEDVLEMMDKAVGDMVTPEDVDKMLADNEDIDFNLEDLVNDLSTEGTLNEKEKEDLKEKIVEVAADAIEEAVKGTEYEEVIDRDLAVYVATSATNQVVTKKAEEMAAAAETEKAEAEAELAKAAEGEALTQEQIDQLMKDLAEAQENNASQAEIEALNKEIETKKAAKAEYAAAAEQAQEKISAAAATAERLQSANTVFADNLASAKDNAVNSGSVGTFVEEIKKNDTVGSAINQVENNRTLQELIKLYAKVDTYDEVCAVKLSVVADALQTERFDDLGNGIVEKVQEWLNQYNLNIPASASLKIGRYSIDNELLQNVRSASTTAELREAVAELFDAMGGLSINAFAEGLDVTVNAGGYSYTVNVTIVK